MLAFMVSNARAQYNNSVQLSASAFWIPNRVTHYNIFRQMGATYERNVYKNFGISLNYHQWMTWAKELRGKEWGYSVGEPEFLRVYDSGTLWIRNRYKMIDVLVHYRYKFNKSVITGKLGYSYCWGNNKYALFGYSNGGSTFGMYDKDVSYSGIVPQISYDYLLLKGRFSVGADIRGRFYSGRSPAQYDYGIHAGVNF